MSLSVSKWQSQRRGLMCYDPVLQFFWRAMVCAGLDARKMLDDGTPSDEALLARWWFAKETKPGDEDYFTSFSCACDVLQRDEDTERMLALRVVDGYELVPRIYGPLEKNVEVAGPVRRWKQVQGPEDARPRWVSYTQECVWTPLEAMPDFDTAECDARLEYLLANPLPDDDPEPVFEGYRCVPALDQGNMFEACA